MEIPIYINNGLHEPIYHQITDQLKALISGGHLEAGTKLPSLRELSKSLDVSLITVRRAYQELEFEKYIITKQGKGTFVAALDKATKQKVKITAVYDGFEKAIETALNYSYSNDQIKEIFQEVLISYRPDEET